MSSLNPASPIPLYAQLADQLLAQIRAGDYAEGERLPSEHALADDYGIGRPTVRQATETLIRRGILARRRGAGTFVRERSAHVDLFSLGGTLKSFSAQGIQLKTRLVKRAKRVRVEEAAEPEHPLAGREVYRLARLGSDSRTPVLLEELWLDANVFPGFDRLPLAGRSLSEVVATRYRLEASSADQSFRVESVGPEDASLLSVVVGSPVLNVERTLHFPTAAAAVFVRMKCRTDNFTFSQRIGGEHG
jgi:GntR family transcriptional regulator